MSPFLGFHVFLHVFVFHNLILAEVADLKHVLAIHGRGPQCGLIFVETLHMGHPVTSDTL